MNEGGYSKLFVVFLDEGNNVVEIEGIPKGVIGSFGLSKDGLRVGFSVSTPTISRDVFVLDLETQQTVRWTAGETAGLTDENLIVLFFDPSPAIRKTKSHRALRRRVFFYYLWPAAHPSSSFS